MKIIPYVLAFFVGVVLVVAGFGVVNGSKDYNKLRLINITYDGVVTAVVSNGNETCQVYFADGTHTKVILGNLALAIGEKYQIVINGIGSLVSETLENQ